MKPTPRTCRRKSGAAAGTRRSGEIRGGGGVHPVSSIYKYIMIYILKTANEDTITHIHNIHADTLYSVYSVLSIFYNQVSYPQSCLHPPTHHGIMSHPPFPAAYTVALPLAPIFGFRCAKTTAALPSSRSHAARVLLLLILLIPYNYL